MLGFALSEHHDAQLAHGALAMAVAVRGGQAPGVILHTDQGSEYTARAFQAACQRLSIAQSMGRPGSALDNALAESVIGLYKAELIKPRGPWRTAGQVELATLGYVDWYNHRRLYETCGDIPPAELETAYYRQNTSLAQAG